MEAGSINMIYLTLGTSKYQFDRLLIYFDKLIDENVIKGDDVFAQIGYSNYNPRNFKFVDFMSGDQALYTIRKANLIVTHAGTGSIINSLKLRKKIIVVPRKSELKEHIDDHQNEIAESFKSRNFVKVARTYNQLKKQIIDIEKFKPSLFVSSNEKINNIIIEYIENI